MVCGHKLRELRDAKGLSNHELSVLSGVPESTLCRILSGQTDNPGVQTVADILKALGADLNDIQDEQRQVPRQDEIPANEALKHLTERIANLETAVEHSRTILREKDRWLMRMFIYCCVLTLMIIALIFVDALVPTAGYIR